LTLPQRGESRRKRIPRQGLRRERRRFTASGFFSRPADIRDPENTLVRDLNVHEAKGGQYMYQKVYSGLRHQVVYLLAWKALKKALSPVAKPELAVLYRMDLSKNIFPRPARIPLRVEPAVPEDLRRLAVLMVEDWGWEVRRIPEMEAAVRARLDRGEICFVARSGAEIAHVNWISFQSQKSFAGRFILLQPDEAYCGGAYTPEAWRGKGLHSAVNSAMLRYLKEHGFRTAYTWANLFNRSSRKAFVPIGWEKHGLVFAVEFHRLRRSRILCLAGSAEPFVCPDVPHSSRGVNHFGRSRTG
jgi:hypothetical protein